MQPVLTSDSTSVLYSAYEFMTGGTPVRGKFRKITLR
jgi:hypothetical protein